MAGHRFRRDDFKSFYAASKQSLLTLVGQAMGKTVQLGELAMSGMKAESEEEPQEA